MSNFTKEHIDRVDARYYTPQERATGVYSIWMAKIAELKATGLTDEDLPSDWDIMCFCAEFLGREAMAIGHEDLLNLAKAILMQIWQLHYSYAPKLYPKPDKSLIKLVKPEEDKYGLSRPWPKAAPANSSGDTNGISTDSSSDTPSDGVDDTKN